MLRFLELLKDVAWPRTCEICSRPSDRPARHICSDCLMRLPFNPTSGLCRKCGRDAPGLDGEFLCDDCRIHKPHFDRAVCALRFEGDARELINRFKFRERIYLRDDFVDFLEAAAMARFRLDKIGYVVPMPSVKVRRWLRGYNLCKYLASSLAKRLGKPCLDILRRTGTPARQGGLSEDERRVNVIGTFAAKRCSGVPLLVDDVMTTGSTLSEAARTLKATGAESVCCIALARSIRV